MEHLRKVLSKLREHQLFVKKEKCKFAHQEILFLGHKVSKGMVMMDEGKVQALLDWLPPRKIWNTSKKKPKVN